MILLTSEVYGCMAEVQGTDAIDISGEWKINNGENTLKFQSLTMKVKSLFYRYLLEQDEYNLKNF
ncbi:MAG TPA: hypothetical protein PK514_15895 [Spirochaetota bacterium]|nr:hypothetical protein [Spirochaetota bacterium]